MQWAVETSQICEAWLEVAAGFSKPRVEGNLNTACAYQRPSIRCIPPLTVTTLSSKAMSVPTVPPPTYELEDEFARGQPSAAPDFPTEAQLLISPSGNTSQFQKGYLGATDERAAVEGEIQIKGVPVASWDNLWVLVILTRIRSDHADCPFCNSVLVRSISLVSKEEAEDRQIELNNVDVELYSRTQPSASSLSTTHNTPSSIPFSIPLTLDTPECIHVGRSSLSHILTATLRTSDPSEPTLTRSIAVHTRRFTAHAFTCDVMPQTFSIQTPTLIEVQVPRTTYRLNEPIPIYVTVPPPDRSVVLDHGYTLRSVRAELIRTVKVLNTGTSDISSDDTSPPFSDDDAASVDTSETESSVGVPPSAQFLAMASSSNEKESPQGTVPSLDVPEALHSLQSPYETILARSGSACRFHSSRPVKVRLILHARPQSPREPTSELPVDMEYGFTDDDAQCASISQTTLMHTVEFRVQFRVTYLHVSSRTEQTYPLIIPITIIPPPAPLPDIDPSLDSAYRKKHDRPPVKTVRREDSDVYVDDHDLNQPGPSALPNGAPPPFDDAPPPFFSVGEASTSSRLPTFFESEAEIIMPSEDHPAAASARAVAPIGSNFEGEGTLFGFPPSEQYDGYSNEMARSSSPPPTLEMARDDTDVTDLADLVNQPERAMGALNMVLEQREQPPASGELLPPPPPPLDDPSDPPPPIDSDFHSRDVSLDPPPSILETDFTSPGMVRMASNHSRTSPSGHLTPRASEAVPPLDMSRGTLSSDEQRTISPSQAPPPYLNHPSIGDTEHASGPPPYVDLVPSQPSSSQT